MLPSTNRNSRTLQPFLQTFGGEKNRSQIKSIYLSVFLFGESDAWRVCCCTLSCPFPLVCTVPFPFPFPHLFPLSFFIVHLFPSPLPFHSLICFPFPFISFQLFLLSHVCITFIITFQCDYNHLYETHAVSIKKKTVLFLNHR